MSPKQVAMQDMKKAGLNVSFFLYDVWFKDGRVFNGGYHPKKGNKLVKSFKPCGV